MSVCPHSESFKVVCVHQGCEDRDLLMCSQCMYTTHQHPTTECVRLDYIRAQMTPIMEMVVRKSSLELELHRQISLKKQSVLEYLDTEEALIKDRIRDMVNEQEMEALRALESENIPKNLLSGLHCLMAKKEADIDKMRAQVIYLETAIEEVENISMARTDKQHSSKRSSHLVPESGQPHKKVNFQAKEDSRPRVPIFEIQDNDDMGEENGKSFQGSNISCKSFEEVIKQIARRTLLPELNIKLDITNLTRKDQKFCSQFLQAIENMRNMEVFSLTSSKAFVFYRFNMETLAKSLLRLPFLKEVHLQFATKESNIEEFLLSRLEKKMQRDNIHLNILKL